MARKKNAEEYSEWVTVYDAIMKSENDKKREVKSRPCKSALIMIN